MSALKEILPNVTTWSEFSLEKQLNFNGYHIAAQGESVIIDPPGLDHEALDALQAKVKNGPPVKAILLSNVHHDRNSRSFKETFSAPILIHENDSPLLDFKADGTFRDGDRLFCGLEVVHLKDQKSPGECAFYFKERNALIVGDALIRKDKLGQLPPDKFKDIALAKKGLAKLSGYEFDALLLGDGEPVLKGGKQAVADFLAG